MLEPFCRWNLEHPKKKKKKVTATLLSEKTFIDEALPQDTGTAWRGIFW